MGTAAARGTATDNPEESGLLTQLFGFAQFEFAGTLAVADGRYLARARGDLEGAESVLVIDTLAVPAPLRRRRRRPAEAAEPKTLPLTRVTAVRASEPFRDEAEASAWLELTVAAEEAIDEVLEDGIALLNRALHVHAAASGDSHVHELTLERASFARIGYGSGEEVAAGEFSTAREMEAAVGPGSRRRQRVAQLRPQERLAAVLGGRERLAVCETLLPRARADLDAGRSREAALQLGIALEALLAELAQAVEDPGHERDLETLRQRLPQAHAAAASALEGEPTPEALNAVSELIEICERVLRRRRVLNE